MVTSCSNGAGVSSRRTVSVLMKCFLADSIDPARQERSVSPSLTDTWSGTMTALHLLAPVHYDKV